MEHAMRRLESILRFAASWSWGLTWWTAEVDEPDPPQPVGSAVDALPPDPERDRVFWSIVEGAGRPFRR
jgi:hypothetical protein